MYFPFSFSLLQSARWDAFTFLSGVDQVNIEQRPGY